MFITPDNLNIINLEFTDYCNAACPMCARFKTDGSLYREKVNQNHTTLATLQKRIPEKIIKQLKKVHSIGTYGDPAMAPECADIYRWIKELNPECKFEMHSNGGARNTDFWKTCAELGIVVMFGIDGLEDTNHLYRRNVKWDKLMANVKAFIGAGGEAQWKWLFFKHNEHQVDEARKLSEQLGFTEFNAGYTDRWSYSNWITGELHDIKKWPAGDYFLEPPSAREEKAVNKNNSSIIFDSENFNNTKKIKCLMASNQQYEVFIRADGNVQPCCMLGDLDVHESKRLIKDPKSVNINHTDLVDILDGEFFKLLDKGINQGSAERLKNCFYTCGVK
jgi:MoaA/NifB/PqqE/SkfB family radical SAM enzyme